MKLYVQRLGMGHPLIILHGLYGSGDNWLSIAKSLSGICEVFLPDQRNHGRSPHEGEHHYDLLAEDLLETMNDLGLAKASILGHSMGGKTAMWFGEKYPSRISHLIVADISPRSYGSGPGDLNHSAFHRQVMEAMLSVDFTLVRSLGDADGQLETSLPNKHLRQFLLKNLAHEPGTGFYWRLNLPVLLRNLDHLSSGLEAFLQKDRMISNFPVLFLRGENSHYISDPDISLIHRMYPHARIKTIPKAGHWLHAEQPAAVVSAIRKEMVG